MRTVHLSHFSVSLEACRGPGLLVKHALGKSFLLYEIIRFASSNTLHSTHFFFFACVWREGGNNPKAAYTVKFIIHGV